MSHLTASGIFASRCEAFGGCGRNEFHRKLNEFHRKLNMGRAEVPSVHVWSLSSDQPGTVFELLFVFEMLFSAVAVGAKVWWAGPV